MEKNVRAISKKLMKLLKTMRCYLFCITPRCGAKEFHVEETPGHVDGWIVVVVVEIVCMAMM